MSHCSARGRRAHWAGFVRDLREAGAVFALGSDWPIAHYDARQVLATARVSGPAWRGLGRYGGLDRGGPEGLMALEG